MVGHGGHVDLEGVGMAQDGVGQGVAHQDDVDTGGVGDPGPGGVVGGGHDQGGITAAALVGAGLGHGDPGGRRIVSHVVGPPCRPAPTRLPAAAGPISPQCTVPPVTAIGGAGDGNCQSCGGPGDELVEVRRVYVQVDDRGVVTGEEVVDEVELWCGSCQSLYPHRPAGS